MPPKANYAELSNKLDSVTAKVDSPEMVFNRLEAVEYPELKLTNENITRLATMFNMRDAEILVSKTKLNDVEQYDRSRSIHINLPTPPSRSCMQHVFWEVIGPMPNGAVVHEIFLGDA